MKTLMTKLSAIMATAAIPLSGVVFADTHGLSAGMGYRQDSIRWDIEDVAQVNPEASSNLHFKDLEIFFLDLRYKGLLGCSLYARANFDYGWILDGRIREQFELKERNNNETYRFHHNGLASEGEFSRTTLHNKTGGNSYVWDINIGIGMPLDLCWCENFQIAPLVGFSYSRQHIKSKDREFIDHQISFDDSSSSSSSSSSSDFDDGFFAHKNHSKFHTAWWGPWVGFDFSYTCECWNLYGEVEIHWGRTDRERASHINHDYFDLYNRTKSFWGPSFRIGSSYIVCEDWFVDGSIGYKHWFSHSNRDDIDWNSADVRIDVGYLF